MKSYVFLPDTTLYYKAEDVIKETSVETEKAAKPKIELRWNDKGDESWCIIDGTRIIGFGSGPRGLSICREALSRGWSLETYSNWPDYVLASNPDSPEDWKTAEIAKLNASLERMMESADEVASQRDEAVELIKQYRGIHWRLTNCHDGDRCPTCIKADDFIASLNGTETE